jgi:hypothetical protein
MVILLFNCDAGYRRSARRVQLMLLQSSIDRLLFRLEKTEAEIGLEAH